MTRLHVWFLVCVRMAEAGCTSVEGEFIRVSDLAPQVTETGLPAGEILFRAPVVGVRRVVERAELRRVLHLPESFPLSPQTLCFERASDTLFRERILESMRAAFSGQEVSIQLKDFSRYPVPKGRLEFPLSGLLASRITRREQRVLWRGKVVGADGRSTPVWARLHLETVRPVLLAKRTIAAGERIEREDLLLDRRPVFPLDLVPALSVDAVAGLTARQRIAAGGEITKTLLAEPYDIEPRQTVSLEVHSDGIQLKLPVIAEGRGRTGDFVWLRQAGTGKRMRGRITGPRRAVLEMKQQPEE